MDGSLLGILSQPDGEFDVVESAVGRERGRMEVFLG
jgi:hypothetical protein